MVRKRDNCRIVSNTELKATSLLEPGVVHICGFGCLHLDPVVVSEEKKSLQRNFNMATNTSEKSGSHTDRNVHKVKKTCHC